MYSLQIYFTQEEKKKVKKSLKSQGGGGGEEEHGPYGSLSRKELEEKVFAQSEALVAQAEKNQKLGTKLNKITTSYNDAKTQLDDLRNNLIKDMDSLADPKNFANVQISELLRLRVQKFDDEVKATMKSPVRGSGSRKSPNRTSRPVTSTSTGKSNTTSPQQYEEEFFSEGEEKGDEATGELKAASDLDKEIRNLKKDNISLKKRLNEALENLQQANELQESLMVLRDKNEDFANRIRVEKDNRAKANSDVARANDKVTQLSEHIEKV
jgi:hypothetical protein